MLTQFFWRVSFRIFGNKVISKGQIHLLGERSWWNARVRILVSGYFGRRWANSIAAPFRRRRWNYLCEWMGESWCFIVPCVFWKWGMQTSPNSFESTLTLKVTTRRGNKKSFCMSRTIYLTEITVLCIFMIPAIGISGCKIDELASSLKVHPACSDSALQKEKTIPQPLGYSVLPKFLVCSLNLKKEPNDCGHKKKRS